MMARSLSLLLQRDTLAELARYVPHENPDDMLIFNPLPYEREIYGCIAPALANPRGRMEDSVSSRQHLDRTKQHRWHEEDLAQQAPESRLLVPPTRVPPFGYRVVKRSDLLTENPILAQSDSATIENHRFRLTVNREQGGIISLYDDLLNWEWINQEHDFRLNQLVQEQVADSDHPQPRHLQYKNPWPVDDVEIPSGWHPDWPVQRMTAHEVVSHRVYETALGFVILQELHLEGVDGNISQRLYLPHHADFIECESSWHMGLTTHPEAFYLLFPFHVPDATVRYDIGGQPVIPGTEQLPGVCRDYFTAQGWVDFSNNRLGMTVALPENPMFQLGDFHFGHYQQTFQLESPTLLGWVTNNYWETNFRAHQPGLVTTRYRLYPHANGFDEAAAHRAGLDALHDTPLLQTMGEAKQDVQLVAESGSLLVLPEPPILTLHLKPHENGLIIRLFNASDNDQHVNIWSGLLTIQQAQLCDLFGNPQTGLAVVDGAISLEILARRIVVLKLNVVYGRSFK
jgi:hypothetical protein